VPRTPGESPAQREFEDNYLGAMTGFPFETTAQATVSGDLNPASVTPQTVLTFDLGAGSPSTPMPVMATAQYVQASKAIAIVPPGGTWTRAHSYAVAFVGGKNGLRGANGEDVIGSQTWALVSSSTSLVTCQDLTA